MTNRGLIVGITLVAALAASGCATKVRMSSAKMCMAHGGTYNASTQMCAYKAQELSAKQACPWLCVTVGGGVTVTFAAGGGGAV